MNTYLIIDIGTGNVRVALTGIGGNVIWVGRDNVIYKRDQNYEDALYFEPEFLWSQIMNLIKEGLNVNGDCKVIAITVSSQREGIVLVNKEGKSVIGFPNHDHRGKFVEDMIHNKGFVYKMTGRYPTSLFSALKLAGYRKKYPESFAQLDCFLSISDWAQFMLTGAKCYEHAQASETLLYDVEKKCWSDKLLDIFGFAKDILPPLLFSGSKLANLKNEYVQGWGLQNDVPVFVGGADTQLAIKSTRPQTGDIVIVSGTTTPVVKLTSTYVLDNEQRSWTNSDLTQEKYILETNCGVTGLNFQRIKEIFYPTETYEVIESELDKVSEPSCFAQLGSLIANDKESLSKGGFLFDVPIMTGLSRADFAFAALWDIACCIKENLDCLFEIHQSNSDYLWCCGGGFQSRHLRKYVAALTGKKLKFRAGFQQASVSGAAVVCSEALGQSEKLDTSVEVVIPEQNEDYFVWYEKWKETRKKLR